MPIYEFECRSCGHRYDHLQKLADADPAVCPVCAAPALHRMVSAPSFRLAGGGWYETDFKKEGDKKRNLVDGGSAAAEPKPAAGSTAAPAAAAPAAPAPAAAAGASSATKPAASD